MRKDSFNGSDTQRIANRTMTVASNFKFQNLERLNTIVGEVSERNNKQISIRAGQIDMSGKVIDVIKNRIKTNCDKLYQNYDENKKAILKQIQQVQTNMLSQNAINKGLENVIKEKSVYDKAKTDLQNKQKKLKKLCEIRDQLKSVPIDNKQITELFAQKFNLIHNLQSFKEALEVQTAVLNNMKSTRRNIKLFLKQKYDKMLTDQQFKKQRIKKLQNINHTKKANLKKIQEALKRQEHCEIPENLAGELQRKLQQYEGKQIYQNIIKHENIISNDMRRQFEQQQILKQEQIQKSRIQKQKEQLKQYQLAYNFYLIKQQQEEKIKKICGVSSLSQIVNNSLQSDFENLQIIQKQTQAAINQIKQENQKIKDQIQQILTGKELYTQQDLLKTEQDYVQAQKQLKILEINSLKKNQLLNQWHSVVQLMCQRQVSKNEIGSILKEVLQIISNTQKVNSGFRILIKNIDKASQNEMDRRSSLKDENSINQQCLI